MNGSVTGGINVMQKPEVVEIFMLGENPVRDYAVAAHQLLKKAENKIMVGVV